MLNPFSSRGQRSWLSRWTPRAGSPALALLIVAAWIAAPAPTAAAIEAPVVAAAPAAAAPTGPTEGMGVTETVAQIMERARAADARAAVEGRKLHFKTEREVERDELPQDVDALPLASFASIEAARQEAVRGTHSAALAPQTVSTNFLGATLADTNAFPPDTMGAVGPTQYVVAVNGRIRTFNKTTGVADSALNADMDTFFTSVMTPPVGSNFTSDPHIRYDRLSGRWFIVIIDVPGGQGTQPNRVLLAVSSGPTISSASSFTFFYFQHDLAAPAGDTSEFADYPTLGIDVNALYIGDNVFTAAGAFAGCSGFVIRKSSVLGAGPIFVTAFRGLVPSASSDGPYTPQGVDNYDSTATEGYFIGVSNAAFGRLILRRVSNPGGTPSISADILIPVSTTQYPVTVPHLGNTGGTNGNLDGLDDRLFAAHIRNNRLWTAHNIQVNTSGVASSTGGRSATRWYELQNVATGGTPSVFQSGTLFDSAASNPTSYFIPSVMVSGQGHAALAFTNAGANARINAGTVGRLVGDTAATLETPALYTASSTAYNPASDDGVQNGSRRWGDYSYTSLDPSDDMTMWTIAEYNDSANSYGVRIAKLLAPPPATPATAGSIAQGATNVNVTVTGTSSSGSGFYDPGAGPAASPFNRIAASVSGTGVTVNSVTFNSSTSLTLNLTATAGATTGARNITVTNPDGQTATGAGILTVTGGAVNAAPVLDASKSPVLTAELEDAAAPSGAVGTLVSSLVDLTPPAGGLDNVADSDAGAVAGMAITAADTANGSWSYSLNGGAAWSAFPAVTNAAALLLPANASARVYFRPNANFNGTLGTAITFRAWDQTAGTAGNTADTSGNGGSTAFSTATDTASLVVTAVNDAPTATNLSVGESYTEDTPLNLVDIVASDIDSANVTATLTLSNPAAGSLSTGTSGAVTSTYVAGAGVWTATGAIANVNTLLAGVVFTPTANFNGNFTIATSVDDGAAAPVTGTKSVTGIAVNDAPTATNLSAAESYTEDTPLNLVDIVATDIDSANVTATLTLSNPAAGSLSTGTSGAVTSSYVAGAGVWTASGAIANVNTLLAGVVFTPAANFNGSFTIATHVDDGVAAAVTGTKTVTGLAVNDAPTATNLSAAESYTEDTMLNLVDVVASDIDSATVTATLTLSNPSAGSLSTGTSGAVTSTYVAGTGVWTASGAIANVNTLLAGVTFVPAANFNGSFTIATSVDDGAAAPVTGSKTVNGIAVNDAPTLDAIANPAPILVDAGLQTINLTGIGAVEAGQGLTITASSDNLALIPNPTVTYISPNASGSLAFTPVAGQAGSAVITVTVTDDGGTANGGVNTFTRTFTQTVTGDTMFQDGFE